MADEEVQNGAPESTDGEASGDEKRPLSRALLVVGIVILLLPAAVPLYFARAAEGTLLIALIATSVAVALLNSLLVFVLWRWFNSLPAESTDSSDPK